MACSSEQSECSRNAGSAFRWAAFKVVVYRIFSVISNFSLRIVSVVSLLEERHLFNF